MVALSRILQIRSKKIRSCVICLIFCARTMIKRFAIWLCISRMTHIDKFFEECDQNQFSNAKKIAKKLKFREDKILAFRKVCMGGWLSMMKWVKEEFNITKEEITEEGYYSLCGVCRSGNVDAIRWMVSEFALGKKRPPSKVVMSCLFISALSGNLEMAWWIAEQYEVTRIEATNDNNMMFIHICAGGTLDIARWFANYFALSREDMCSNDFGAFASACANGHLETARWLVEKCDITEEEVRTGDNEIIRVCCTRNRIKIIQWLIIRFRITKDEIKYCSDADDHVTSVEFGIGVELDFVADIGATEVVSDTAAVADTAATDNSPLQLALTNGHIPLYKWLCKYYSITPI